MKAYSEDLRSRIVAAVDGGMPRSEAARTHEDLLAALWAALAAISPADARGYFTHCGYPPLAQAA